MGCHHKGNTPKQHKQKLQRQWTNLMTSTRKWLITCFDLPKWLHQSPIPKFCTAISWRLSRRLRGVKKKFSQSEKKEFGDEKEFGDVARTNQIILYWKLSFSSEFFIFFISVGWSQNQSPVTVGSTVCFQLLANETTLLPLSLVLIYEVMETDISNQHNRLLGFNYFSFLDKMCYGLDKRTDTYRFAPPYSFSNTI